MKYLQLITSHDPELEQCTLYPGDGHIGLGHDDTDDVEAGLHHLPGAALHLVHGQGRRVLTPDQRTGAELIAVQVCIVKVFEVVYWNVFDLRRLGIKVPMIRVLIITARTSFPFSQVFSDISRVVFAANHIRKTRP